MESESIRESNLHQSKDELKEPEGQFGDVFSVEHRWTHVLQHEIKTPPGVLIHKKPFRVPECQDIEAEVAHMLQIGVTEESSSPWSSPIIIVPKPDGSLRLCND